jgi:hypothetical protein
VVPIEEPILSSGMEDVLRFEQHPDEAPQEEDGNIEEEVSCLSELGHEQALIRRRCVVHIMTMISSSGRPTIL